MTEDHRQEPLPEASQSREATVGESSSQHRSGCGLRQVLRKVKKNVTKKVSKRFKRSRHQVPVVQNTDHESVLSNQNTELTSRLHPSDGDKPATSKNLTSCGNQGASREPASKVLDAPPGVEEIPDPQSVDAELQAAREATESMALLGGRVTSFVSKAEDGPKYLAAADDIPTTYL
ncbi:uncharacterized protein F5147DRAFT_775421 [Suillus discolor]|uniref:Uncharacterized protein n=1 Tax=Suillus discolor TaxID=1912936 RepID=A0A9P7F485_9AGAM|nr:uncharacterized protein F5147DRAFT_775421 [Suillus discolor]KAG2105103.1 hypothetical protein F5147DRAFT_775421 [Suillus discolor]